MENKECWCKSKTHSSSEWNLHQTAKAMAKKGFEKDKGPEKDRG